MTGFESMAPESRIWIFMANRILNSNEMKRLHAELTAFVLDWKAHGTPLSAAYQIQEDNLVIIAVDESMAAPSGCSIDKAFRLLEQFGKETQTDFFQRTLTVAKTLEGIKILDRTEATEALGRGEITKDTFVFNTTLQKLTEMDTQFLIPFSQHWLGRKLIKSQIPE
jgi:hypothetical protein